MTSTKRMVYTHAPSFPEVIFQSPIPHQEKIGWQVLCGDTGQWRVGIASPAEAQLADNAEFEQHDCPELFLLLWGKMTLATIEDGEIHHHKLQIGKPILVTAPHTGYCPDGPHQGAAFVVERDTFRTEYRRANDWFSDGKER